MSLAYFEGRHAFETRQKRETNPYANQPDKVQEYEDWDRGWKEAFNELWRLLENE